MKKKRIKVGLGEENTSISNKWLAAGYSKRYNCTRLNYRMQAAAITLLVQPLEKAGTAFYNHHICIRKETTNS